MSIIMNLKKIWFGAFHGFISSPLKRSSMLRGITFTYYSLAKVLYALRAHLKLSDNPET